MADINWAQVIQDAGNMKPIDPGTYLVTLSKVEAKVASSGNHYWKATMHIQVGEHAGKPVYNNFVLSQANPKALQQFFKTMLALGLSQDMIAQAGAQGGDDAIARLLTGRQATAVLTASTDPQYPDPDVQWVNAHPNGPIAQGGIATPGAAPVPGAVYAPAGPTFQEQPQYQQPIPQQPVYAQPVPQQQIPQAPVFQEQQPVQQQQLPPAPVYAEPAPQQYAQPQQPVYAEQPQQQVQQPVYEQPQAPQAAPLPVAYAQPAQQASVAPQAVQPQQQIAIPAPPPPAF